MRMMRTATPLDPEARWSERWLIGSAAHRDGAHFKERRLTFHADVRMSQPVNKSRQLICATRLSLIQLQLRGQSECGAS